MNTESADAGINLTVETDAGQSEMDAGHPVLPGSENHHIPVPPTGDGGSFSG